MSAISLNGFHSMSRASERVIPGRSTATFSLRSSSSSSSRIGGDEKRRCPASVVVSRSLRFRNGKYNNKATHVTPIRVTNTNVRVSGSMCSNCKYEGKEKRGKPKDDWMTLSSLPVRSKGVWQSLFGHANCSLHCCYSLMASGSLCKAKKDG